MFPMAQRTFEDSTAADKTSIGFDYQYYYFLNKLLELKKGEKIGYEVKDDVHIELADGKLVLFQIKHSLKTNSKDEPVNLTERDGDLWKTLYNWIGVVNDEALGRDVDIKQIEFMNNAEFVLASNKKDNEKNRFLVNVKRFKVGQFTITEFRHYLDELIAETKDPDKGENELKKYMKALYRQNDDWLICFITRLNFDLDQDEMIQKIRNKIAEKIYEDDEIRIDEVFDCVNSQASLWKYDEIKKGNKMEVSYDDVRNRFYKCFHNARSKTLPNRKFKVTLPERLEDQVFIKQLVDIGDIEKSDIEVMAEYTTDKMSLSKNLESWIQQSYLTEDERKRFEEDCVAKWKMNFRKVHRPTSTKTPVENALDCLDKVRDLELEIQEQKIGTPLSHGLFYSLSDTPIIGWLPDWEDRYKK